MVFSPLQMIPGAARRWRPLDGDKVKVTLRFRGREMAHQEIGRELLHKIADDIDGLGKIESMPKMEGRQMIMVASPVKPT